MDLWHAIRISAVDYFVLPQCMRGKRTDRQKSDSRAKRIVQQIWHLISNREYSRTFRVATYGNLNHGTLLPILHWEMFNLPQQSVLARPTVYSSINHCYRYDSYAAPARAAAATGQIIVVPDREPPATPLIRTHAWQCPDKQFAVKRRIAGRATHAILYSRDF